ncbi:GlyGly-CTERM sorting domain-containing protein [Vibrio anguillarum]|uniref:trypsin-like serine protease n=1 Tax=Vibrio anguillarum TaxID=55601 RepID=UPI00188A0737|nr:trypsin-like serine protease [Vibrio anguillarum]MBF4258239.1 GlyGly-CTERM sorting domain-containing protein [Vibrio anguillarum]MBF4277314.1 GlyGly-CTERM sorting domain-containing protein [Vibrio anguillarum]MBF4300070.1 GlyGly-CTERM sorting domain-containing protein [Vibrio anguillarum]MBF4335625.1 GlyGly-CTERM sorting domain-containing protein [Vibrio anguillarum]MBF4362029.1 GlyGly-CTERM sorting domain-containing protein [Vibrio anguillarum]
MIRNDMMNKWVVLFSSLAFSGNVFAVDAQPYIVNGTDASVTEFPSIASLFFDQIAYNGSYGKGSYCGASLLNNQYVLTAAHCVYGNSANQLFTSVVPKLQIETDFPYNILEKARVAEIYYPSTYNSTTFLDDIAILKLEAPLTMLSSADYLTRPTANSDSTYRSLSETFIAVGHGNTSSNIDTKTYLQKTNLAYVANSSCIYSSTAVPDTNLCMSGSISALTSLKNATCQGDSGGPLFWHNGGNYIQVGITSFGPNTKCGDPLITAPSVFTEILDYSTWIESVLLGSEPPKFVATEAKRQAYLNPPSDSGGSFGWWSLLLMFIPFIRRR